jgi:hypothetical protein
MFSSRVAWRFLMLDIVANKGNNSNNNKGLIKHDYQFVINKNLSEEGFSVILHFSVKEADRIINQNIQKPRRP